MSEYLKHIPCTQPNCASSDGMATYRQEDGTVTGFCFVCQGYDPDPLGANPQKEEEPMETKESVNTVVQYGVRDLPDRHLRAESLSHFGIKVSVSPVNGEIDAHYYPLHKKGQLVGYQKRVVAEKKFYGIGDNKGVEFVGQHLHPHGGQMILITEGVLDAASAWQMFKDRGKNYKVVSLPHGTGSALQVFKAQTEWLDKFDNVVLAFDQDAPGKKAAKDVSEVVTPGKVRVMTFSEKDANDILIKGKHNEWYEALGNSQVERPDGIVSGSETWDKLKEKPHVESLPYPDEWDELNRKTYGIRIGELDTWTSGSGMGKTQIVRELQYHLLKNTEANVGIMALEEPLTDSVEALMALELNKRISLPDVREETTEEEMYEAWQATAGTNRVHFYDHFGSVDDESLIAKIRYLARGLDCKYIFLDHLSIVISEFADQGGERERIDTVMTKLKNLTQELGIWIGLIVHLRKTGGGVSFEEGGVPTLDDLRGSGAIKQLSNNVYALARNQQAHDETVRNTSHLHVLKCRFTGDTGEADDMFFDRDTGRMRGVAKQIGEEEYAF